MEKKEIQSGNFFPEWNACYKYYCKTITVAIICELVVGFNNRFTDFLAANTSFPVRLDFWECS